MKLGSKNSCQIMQYRNIAILIAIMQFCNVCQTWKRDLKKHLDKNEFCLQNQSTSNSSTSSSSGTKNNLFSSTARDDDQDDASDDYRYGDYDGDDGSDSQFNYEVMKDLIFADYSGIPEQVELYGDHDGVNSTRAYSSTTEREFESTFGLNCLKASSIEEFIAMVQSNASNDDNAKEEKLGRMELLTAVFAEDTGLSIKDGERLLNLLNQYGTECVQENCGDSMVNEGNIKLPIKRKYETLYKITRKDVKENFMAEEVVPFPPSWKMDQMKTPLKAVVIRGLDPLTEIATKLSDPLLMFLWGDQFEFAFQEERDEDSGERVFSHFMSGEFMEHVHEVMKCRPNIPADAVVLPVIMYIDGVSLGKKQQQSIKNCLLSLGVYKPPLFRSPISKISIGYPVTFDNISKDLLEAHLLVVFNGQVGKVKEEMKEFSRVVYFKWLTNVIQTLEYSWRYGVKMHILGRGECTVYTKYSLTVGDHPQQQQTVGSKEGQSKHSCRSCEYPTLTMDEYSPIHHRFRSESDIYELLKKAQPIRLKQRAAARSNRSWGSAEEKTVLKDLSRMCLQNYPISPLLTHCRVGCGHPTLSLFRSMSPSDDFHTLCAGILCAVKSWIIVIIVFFNKGTDAKYNNVSVSLMERRVAQLGRGHDDMPHVNWAPFTDGLSRFATRTKEGKENHATGNTGGLASEMNLTICLMLIFIIGTNGDILPNTDDYEYSVPRPKKQGGTAQPPSYSKVAVGNVSQKIMLVLTALVDVYMEIKRQNWTQSLVEDLRRRLLWLDCHEKILWELLTSLCDTEIDKDGKSIGMTKMHAQMHIGDTIAPCGVRDYTNTDTFEGCNKFVSKLWSQSSKRVLSGNEEFNRKLQLRTVFHRMATLQGFKDHGMKYLKTPAALLYAAPTSDKDVVFRQSLNTRAYQLILKNGVMGFLNRKLNYNVDALTHFETTKSLVSFSQMRDIIDFCLDGYSISAHGKKKGCEINKCVLSLLGGVHAHGGQFSNNRMYADKETDMYDYVRVQHNHTIVTVRLVFFIRVVKNNFMQFELSYHGVGVLMKRVDDDYDPATAVCFPFPRYGWDVKDGRLQTILFNLNDVVEKLYGFPVFTETHTMSTFRPSKKDVVNVMDHAFLERTHLSPSPNYCEYMVPNTTKEEYLQNHQTSSKKLPKQHEHVMGEEEGG